jgi:type I restriction enzyme M protein
MCENTPPSKALVVFGILNPLRFLYVKRYGRLVVRLQYAATSLAWVETYLRVVGYDISAKNPNRNEVVDHKSPLELVEKIKENNSEIAVLLDEIEMILTA